MIIAQVVTSLSKLVNMKIIGTKHCFGKYYTSIISLIFDKFLLFVLIPVCSRGLVIKVLKNRVIITRNDDIDGNW
jgi:hypothetical protein